MPDLGYGRSAAWKPPRLSSDAATSSRSGSHARPGIWAVGGVEAAAAEQRCGYEQQVGLPCPTWGLTRRSRDETRWVTRPSLGQRAGRCYNRVMSEPTPAAPISSSPAETTHRSTSPQSALPALGTELGDRPSPTDLLSQLDPTERTRDPGFLRFKRSHFYMALAPLAFVVGLAAGYVFWGRDQPTVSAVGGGQPNLAQQPSRYEVPVDDDPSIGPKDAPIVMIEFSDFNCPYCKRWHQETFQPLMSAYQDKILFVYRDYPVTSQESFVAAQAANCAGEQGEYWAFHDALFSGPYGLGQEAYQQYAVDIGLDAAQLQECIQSGKYASEVESDARFASSLGITGTPTFFVNGIPIVGAVPLSSFKQVIDAELKK